MGPNEGDLWLPTGLASLPFGLPRCRRQAFSKMCSTKRALSLKVGVMRAKLVAVICVAAITLGGAVSCPAADDHGPLAVVADAAVVRPACLVATAIGSAVFVVALPWAAASRSIKETAQMLVIKPAQATFTRPLGDMDALLEE